MNTHTAPATAMVLAAGRGERLRPLTDLRPKPLIPLGCRPMIGYVLDLLAAHGIRRVHLNTHHLGKQLPAALGDGADHGVTLHYHPETTLLGTGGGLRAALSGAPRMADGPLVMINADVLCDVNLTDVIAHHIRTGAHATLVLRRDDDAERYGLLGYDHTGRIRRFLEVENGPADRLRMFTGIQILSPTFLHSLADRPEVFPITDCYKEMVAAGAPIFAWDHAGYWNDLGTPERLLAAEADLAEGRFIPAGEGG